MIQFPKSNDDKSIAVIEYTYICQSSDAYNNNKKIGMITHMAVCIHSRNAPLDRRKRK